MLALFFLSGSIVLGVASVKRATRNLLDPIEQLLWGIVSGWVIAALAAYVIARYFRELTSTQTIALTILIWLSAAALIAVNRRPGFSSLPKFRWQRYHTGLLILLLAFTPIFCTLFWTHMFAPGAGGIWSGGSAAYDMSFHAALTTSFLYGGNFPPRYLFLPPEQLRYPF